MAIKWREYQHPRNPDGTFRDKESAEQWAKHISGMLSPGEAKAERLPVDVYNGDEGGDDDPEWEYDPTQAVWDDADIGDGLRLTKRVGGSMELAAHHDDDTVTPLLHFNDMQARQFDRAIDFLQGITPYDRKNDYYQTALDEYGMLTHVKTGGVIVGITPEGEYKVITLHRAGAGSISFDEDAVRRFTQQLREYESWGEGDVEEDEE